MGKYLKQGFARELEWQLARGEISHSKMVELMEAECIKNYKADNPTEKTVHTMIEGIISEFEWERVHHAMGILNWRWAREEGLRVPTIDEIKEYGARLLHEAAKSRLVEYKDEHPDLGIIRGSGGFEAEAWCDEEKTKIVKLELKFVLSSWDEEI